MGTRKVSDPQFLRWYLFLHSLAMPFLEYFGFVYSAVKCSILFIRRLLEAICFVFIIHLAFNDNASAFSTLFLIIALRKPFSLILRKENLLIFAINGCDRRKRNEWRAYISCYLMKCHHNSRNCSLLASGLFGRIA